MLTKRIAATASILGLSLFAATPSFANLDAQFSQCAASALESKNITASKISVDLPTSSADLLNHSYSTETRQLKMKLANAKSGKSLGLISCQVDGDGVVKSVRYLSKAS